MPPIEIAVRAYVPTETISFSPSDDEPNCFDRILVFDTETTTDSCQTLKFGSFKIYENGRLVHRGVFYNTGQVSPKEKETLEGYCNKHNIKLRDVREFIDDVFLRDVYDLKTLCGGFNLPFDLTRLAESAGYARKDMKGGYSLKLTENKGYPRLTIKRNGGGRTFIKFTKSSDENRRKLTFKGNFLDLHTLVFALTNENHMLESACKLFGADVAKGNAEQHGKITPEYIDYNLRDVDATYELFLKAMAEFDLYGLDTNVTKVYSPASLGKTCLKMMDVRPFLDKNNGRISNEVLGYAASAYIGGRSEVKIRKQPVLVTLLDFASMYPSICILTGLWDFIICDHIEQRESIEEVTEFVKTITLDDLRRRETWSKLNAIVQVEPNEDVLPVRAKFDNKQTYNVALPYITADLDIKPWFALADVLVSKLLTGKAPKILRAIRFIAVGKQQELTPITLFGKTIDPYKHNFFKAIIEHRKELQLQRDNCKLEGEKALLDKKQKAVKTIANATSYGVYMEINPEEREADVTAYGLKTKQCHVNKVEKFGKQTNPIIAPFITAGARLVLGTVESTLAKHGAIHAFCDTDSMAVPPQYTKDIQDFFSALNPYSFDAPLFKVEQENVWFYGISAKRYALYKRDEKTGKIEIVKASSHGLGHLLSPFTRKGSSNWHEDIWLDILKLHYGMITLDSVNEKYGGSFALAKLAISTPQIMKRFERLNKGKSYDQQIKPFNFCIVGFSNAVDESTGKPVKPLAPYRKNAQQCPYDSFIDYESGKELKGLQYWKPFANVFWDYVNHPEAKFDGDVGVLARKHVTVGSVVHIGKESNNLEQAEVLGVQDDDYVVYGSPAEQLLVHKEMILLAEPKDVNKFGISQRTLYNLKRALTAGRAVLLKGRTVRCILAYVAHINNNDLGEARKK